jgi:hypothetical protein
MSFLGLSDAYSLEESKGNNLSALIVLIHKILPQVDMTRSNLQSWTLIGFFLFIQSMVTLEA